MNFNNWEWINEPDEYGIEEDRVWIKTRPMTGLWNTTYYDYDDMSAHMLQTTTDEQCFTFKVRADFDSKYGFDGGGIVMFLDEKNWLKVAAEYGDENEQYFGSVVTLNGYSDWASFMIDESIKTIWYRLSRIREDFVLEYSFDGENYKQMRMFHMNNATGQIRFGVYACSPDESTCTVTFSEMDMGECLCMPE